MWTGFRKGNGREREREEGGRGAVVAIECAWLLQLTDNWWSPTLKFQAIWIPSSSFSVVFSSIGKILFAGSCRDPTPSPCFHSVALHNFTPEWTPNLSGYIKGSLRRNFTVTVQKQRERNYPALQPSQSSAHHASSCRSFPSHSPCMHPNEKLFGF